MSLTPALHGIVATETPLELLPRVPYKDLKPVETELPPRQSQDYKRPKKSSQRFVPEIY